MYHVCFTLPTGGGNLAAQFAAYHLKDQLNNWTKTYGIPHKSYPKGYTYIVELALDKDATWFALTWEGRKYDTICKV